MSHSIAAHHVKRRPKKCRITDTKWERASIYFLGRMDLAACTVKKKTKRHPCGKIICYRLIVIIFCSANFSEWFSSAIWNESNTGSCVNSDGFKVHPILKFSEIIHVTVFKKAQMKATQIRHTGTWNSS